MASKLSRILFSLLAATGLAIGSAGLPAMSATVTPGKATSVVIASVEGSITVSWKKATAGSTPNFYQVKAVSNTGKVSYPCPKESSVKFGKAQSDFKCVFTGRDGIKSYDVSVISTIGSATSGTVAASVAPIATKTLTLTGKLTGDLTKPGVSTKCAAWNLKGASGIGNIPAICQLQVLAVTANGLVFSSANTITPPVAATKSFSIKIRAVNASRANVTLQLARGDGSYIGPVLFTDAGKNTLNGQSFLPKSTAPADKTIDLGSFKFHTRNNATAFMTALKSPASADLRANLSLMTSATGSDVAKVPVGAGKAGFADTSKIIKASWGKVLAYPVQAKLALPKSTAFSTRTGAASVRRTVSIGADGFAKVTVSAVTPVDCSTFFDTGSQVAISDCLSPVSVYLQGLGIDSDLVTALKQTCAAYSKNAAANFTWIMSKDPSDSCRTALSAISDAMQNMGNDQGGNGGGGQDCGSFLNMNSTLTLKDCYSSLLQQVSQQNPTMVFAFTTACAPYGATDESGKPIDAIRFAKPSNFKTLVTSKTDVCGLFFRINMAGSGDQNTQIQIPKECKTSFGSINDPTGFLSTACYGKLSLINSIAGTADIPKICPATLVNLPKSQWGDPVAGIGYSGAFNCLMLLQTMGAGATNETSPDCGANSSGMDTDTDGIPNALDVDDDGDLVIDTADDSGGVQGCNIEPAKSVRTTILNPLNYGLIGSGAKGFNGDKTSSSYGMLTGSNPYSVADLNSSINYALSGSDFSISYYLYKSDFLPNALLDAQGTMPAVWVTCPGVIWCDPATSHATVTTGMGMQNARFALTGASYSASKKTLSYLGANSLKSGDIVSISGFNPGNVEFNYTNLQVASATASGFVAAAPAKYCTFQSDGSNEVMYDAGSNCWESSFEQVPNWNQNATASISPMKASATVANENSPSGFNRVAFNYASNSPWSANNSSGSWSDASQNRCAAAAETNFLAAQKAMDDANTALATTSPSDPNYGSLRNTAEQARRLLNLAHMDRSFKTPCWFELSKPVVFSAVSDDNGQCQTLNYNPTWTTSEAIPTRGNFLWQTRCTLSDVAAANSYMGSRMVQGAFISPNINQLDVNTNSSPADDISAKDALSATDVLTLNYIANDGTSASIATTIGAYPITAPLIRSFNGKSVDYSKVAGAQGKDRPLGSTGSLNCTYSETEDCLPNAVVIDPSVKGSETLTVSFDRPQREAFPGESATNGYHDVYGLSYGLELDASGAHLGCGSNFSASKGNGMPVSSTAYKNFSSQFAANVSSDSGAAYLAPLKDKVVDTGLAAAASAVRLSITLDLVKCLRERSAFLADAGVILKNLQLPYGARTDGLASGWVPVGTGNGDPNCIQIMLQARGEGKTGGTDAAGQQFCLQLAPGALTDWSYDSKKNLVFTPNTVHGGNYLTPIFANIQSNRDQQGLSANAQMQNFTTFSPSCQWESWLTDESDGSKRVDASGPDASGTVSATGLTEGHQYVVHSVAKGCAPRVLESNPNAEASRFTASAQGGGGNCDPNTQNCGGNCDPNTQNCGGNCDPNTQDCNGCNQNCGGGDISTPHFGNSWQMGGNELKTFIYKFDDSKYEFQFALTDTTSSTDLSSKVSAPQEEVNNGTPTGFWFVNITGIDMSTSGKYLLEMRYRLRGTSDLFTGVQTNIITPPSGNGCIMTSTKQEACPTG